MTEPEPLYYDEGASGTNKYTFEVYPGESGGYVAYARRWNRKLNLIQEETRYTSPDKAGLRAQSYPRTRLIKVFLASDFWSDAHV